MQSHSTKQKGGKKTKVTPANFQLNKGQTKLEKPTAMADHSTGNDDLLPPLLEHFALVPKPRIIQAHQLDSFEHLLVDMIDIEKYGGQIKVSPAGFVMLDKDDTSLLKRYATSIPPRWNELLELAHLSLSKLNVKIDLSQHLERVTCGGDVCSISDHDPAYCFMQNINFLSNIPKDLSLKHCLVPLIVFMVKDFVVDERCDFTRSQLVSLSQLLTVGVLFRKNIYSVVNNEVTSRYLAPLRTMANECRQELPLHLALGFCAVTINNVLEGCVTDTWMSLACLAGCVLKDKIKSQFNYRVSSGTLIHKNDDVM